MYINISEYNRKMSGSDKLPMTKEELNAIIATAKAEAIAEAKANYDAELAKVKATLQNIVDTAATDASSRNLQLIRENEIVRGKYFLDKRLFNNHNKFMSLLVQIIRSFRLRFFRYYSM